MKATTDPIPADLIKTDHAARIAKSHISTVYRWITKGKLRAWRLVGRWFVSRAELMDLFQAHEPASGGDGPASPPAFATRQERKRMAAWSRKVLEEAGVR